MSKNQRRKMTKPQIVRMQKLIRFYGDSMQMSRKKVGPQMMSNEQYQTAIDTIGLSQIKASKFFEVSHKTSPRWARGESPIPGAVAKLLRVMVQYEITPEDVESLK